MNKKYVYIGRFQLPHMGHEKIIEHAIKNADTFTILIGSVNAPIDEKNPFTFEDRKEMIERICNRIIHETGKKIPIFILPLKDFNDNDRWVKEVKILTEPNKNEKVILAGCKKDGDASTFYLDLFPEWKQDFIEEVSFPGVDVISSTKLRKIFFSGEKLPDVVSETTKNYLDSYSLINLSI